MNNDAAVLEQPEEVTETSQFGLNDKDLPSIIQGQVSKLDGLSKSVAKALDAAAAAKESAASAKEKSAGFGKKKVAIEELQAAGLDLAEAVQSGAEAQKISFEFQTKLAEITKYLFGLGVSNIASNRAVVRELELKLRGASQEELSELARQELISVVKQLKEQEDILRKQENFAKVIRIHDERIKSQAQLSEQIDEQLQAQADIVIDQGEQLKTQREKIIEQNGQIAVLQEKNHDLHERMLRNQQLIEAQAEQINMLEKEIHTELSSKANRIGSIITMAIAMAALTVSVSHFFIK